MEASQDKQYLHDRDSDESDYEEEKPMTKEDGEGKKGNKVHHNDLERERRNNYTKNMETLISHLPTREARERARAASRKEKIVTVTNFIEKTFIKHNADVKEYEARDKQFKKDLMIIKEYFKDGWMTMDDYIKFIGEQPARYHALLRAEDDTEYYASLQTTQTRPQTPVGQQEESDGYEYSDDSMEE